MAVLWLAATTQHRRSKLVGTKSRKSTTQELFETSLSVVRPGYDMILACEACGRPDGRHEYLCTLDVLKPAFWEQLVNRNWRRVGNGAIKPLNDESCCPRFRLRCAGCAHSQVTTHAECTAFFRVNVSAFHPSLAQKLVLKTLAAVVKDSLAAATTSQASPAADFDTLVRQPEVLSSGARPAHTINVALEDPSCTGEFIAIYAKSKTPNMPDIQSGRHGVIPENAMLFQSLFCKYKVDGRDRSLGTKFLVLRFDGRVVALHVLDVLPGSIASAKLIIDSSALPDVDLKTFMHLRTIALARQLGKTYYHPGMYSHGDAKSHELVHFRPVSILDPVCPHLACSGQLR